MIPVSPHYEAVFYYSLCYTKISQIIIGIRLFPRCYMYCLNFLRAGMFALSVNSFAISIVFEDTSIGFSQKCELCKFR